MGIFRGRVARTAQGTFTLRLPRPERELLANLAEQLREVLLVTTDDPSLRRLFPTAYHEDVERDREYQQLVRDELLERRLASLATLEATAEADEVTEEELSGWLTALNDVRLVLGTRLDVSEDDDSELEEDDPDAPALAVYGYLGYLLGEVVDALADALPPPTDTEI